MTSSFDPSGYQDPGWSFLRHRRTGGGVDGVIELRFLYLSLLMTPFLMLFVLVNIFPEVGRPRGPLPVVVVALGLAGIGLALWTAGRELDVTRPSALTASYRAYFFLGFALVDAMLLVAFTLTFTEGELWPFLLDLPFFLVGMWVVAPSRRNFAKRQEQIQRQGSTLSLGAAIAGTGPGPSHEL